VNASTLTGLLVAATTVIGVLACICGLIAILSRGDYVGGGACLAAGAIAFGLLANAVLRE
jgi:hypothetical protein